jgi:serine/threonine protein kinase
VPLEIYILSRLSHPNIVQYLEHFEERDYILLVTELHGTEWNVANPLLNPIRNPGLRQTSLLKAQPSSATVTTSAVTATSTVTSTKDPAGAKDTASIIECSPLFRLTPEQEKSIRRRTSCDLFECIDCHARMPESTIRRIFAQIALAVDALHSKGVCVCVLVIL